MEVKSTRLKSFRSKDIDLLVEAINGLPFKVELKSLAWNGKQFFQTFVLPDNAPNDFLSLDLDEAG